MSYTTGPTDFTGIVNSIQALTQAVLLNGSTKGAIAQAITDLGQSTLPVGAHNFLSGTTISATTGTLTAPTNGAAIVLGMLDNSVTQGSTGAVTSSLSGLVTLADTGTAAINRRVFAYLPMATAQSSTFTGSFSVASTAYLGVMIGAFFLPMA